jgi:hypothetical protein
MRLRKEGPDMEGERVFNNGDGPVVFTPAPSLLQWLPFSYIFGLLPAGMRLKFATGKKKITWDPALHPELSQVKEELAKALPAPIHLAPGQGLKPVNPAIVSAFDDVENLLRMQMAPQPASAGLEPSRDKRRRERVEEVAREKARIARGVDASVPEAEAQGAGGGSSTSTTTTATATSPRSPSAGTDDPVHSGGGAALEEGGDLAISMLGDLSAVKAASAAEEAKAKAAEAARLAAEERARLEEENKRFTLRLGGRVLLEGTLPSFLRKSLPPLLPQQQGPSSQTAAAAVAATAILKPQRSALSGNSVLLALHTRFGGSRLSKGGGGGGGFGGGPLGGAKSAVNRSLDVKDEPPPDAGTQAAMQMAEFEKKARARAMGHHTASRTKTGTKASHPAVGGSGKAKAIVVHPEAGDLPGAVGGK